MARIPFFPALAGSHAAALATMAQLDHAIEVRRQAIVLQSLSAEGYVCSTRTTLSLAAPDLIRGLMV